MAFATKTVFPICFHNRKGLDVPDAPFIVFANHTSMLDPPVIAYACRRYEIHFLGKRELTRNSIARYVLTRIHMITVARNASDIAAMRLSSEVLKRGKVLGVFPEGTRRPPGELMQKVETGLGLIALRAGVPMVPVYIHGKIRAFRLTHVYVGDPVTPDMLRKGGSDSAALNGLIARTILEMRDSAKNF